MQTNCDCRQMGFGALDIDPNLYVGAGTPGSQMADVGGLTVCTGIVAGELTTYTPLFGDFNGDGVVDVIQTDIPIGTSEHHPADDPRVVARHRRPVVHRAIGRNVPARERRERRVHHVRRRTSTARPTSSSATAAARRRTRSTHGRTARGSRRPSRSPNRPPCTGDDAGPGRRQRRRPAGPGGVGRSGQRRDRARSTSTRETRSVPTSSRASKATSPRRPAWLQAVRRCGEPARGSERLPVRRSRA